VIVIGIVVLVGLAVAIALVGVVQRRSIVRAWRVIAVERQRNWEERRRLVEAADGCRGCPYRAVPR
jgi:hypothetical protein